MKTNPRNHADRARIAAFFSACAVAASVAFAAEPNPETEITIRAERVTSQIVGRSYTGIPIRQYQLSYTVGYADLDLTTDAGAKELKKRVQQAADSACKDLDKLYPETPRDRTCANKAAEDSMAQVNRVITLAQTQAQPKAE